MINIIEIIKEKFLVYQGQRFLAKGKPEKAYYYFHKVIFLNETPKVFLLLAITLMDMGRYAEALIFFTKIEKVSDNELVLIGITECNIMLRKWDEAISFVNDNVKKSMKLKIIQEMLDNPIRREKYVIFKEFSQKGYSFIEKNDFKNGLIYLKKAEEISDQDAHLMNNIGSILNSLGEKPEKVYPYFEKALLLEPNNKRFKENLFYIKKKIKK